MRSDLQGLKISTRELQQLTNLPVNYELVRVVNFWQTLGQRFVARLQGPEAATAVFIGVSSFVIIYCLLYALVGVFMQLPSWMVFILSFLGINGLAQLGFYLLWKQKQKQLSTAITPSLRILLYDVERYNNAIQAIHINDELEAAGNPEVKIRDRAKVIQALELTRVDLVRALKTERIMRENQSFIINNADLFADNLATLSALQVKEKASEHGRLLNEALEIALDVQGEMRKLQGLR